MYDRAGMILDHNERFINMTHKYLAASLLYYEEARELEQLPSLAWGIGDQQRPDLDNKNLLFCLIDTGGIFKNVEGVTSQERCHNTLSQIRKRTSYYTDYEYDNIDGTLHMICFKIPERHGDILKRFKLGEYSKMYTRQFIGHYLAGWKRNIKPSMQVRYKVLTHDMSYKKFFEDKVKSDFRYKGTLYFPPDVEFDYPPHPRDEVFNFNKLTFDYSTWKDSLSYGVI